jgi:hypothetical protein
VNAHAHCPCDCEHPQPFQAWIEGICVELCGCCWVRYEAVCVMIPCTPENCH